MLLDALNISPVLGNVIKSVTTSAECLGWVFFLFVVTVIIYAAFGLFNFEDSVRTQAFFPVDLKIKPRTFSSF